MMKHFHRIAEGIDVTAALAQLDAQPELWNHHDRRRSLSSPHRETSDLWLRYRRLSEIDRPGHATEPHESLWYRSIFALPAVGRIIDTIVAIRPPARLGGVLVTRIPPGCQVYPHSDKGAWHADYYDYKVWLPLRANDLCLNHCEDEIVVMRAGDAWSYDNAKTHSVENRGKTERLCLIVSMRAIESGTQ